MASFVPTHVPTQWNDGRIDRQSGDWAWWLDFSVVTDPDRDLSDGL